MGDRFHGMARRAVKGGLKGHALRRACPWHATPDATLELTVAGGLKVRNRSAGEFASPEWRRPLDPVWENYSQAVI
jgi:hypothetical protein